MGVVYIVGRVLYGIGYRAKGPAGRTVGVVLLDPALLALLISAIMSGVALSGGVGGLTHFVASYWK
jgi:hypothetical protein